MRPDSSVIPPPPKRTRRDGDALIFESPWWHIRFDDRHITITNIIYGRDLAITTLTHNGAVWRQIEHEGRSYNPGKLVYGQTTGRFYTGVPLPSESALRPEFGDNLSALALTLHYIHREDPEWLAPRPILESARRSTMYGSNHWRCPIPHFFTEIIA